MGIRCPVCGFINLIDDRFCGICLTDLKAEKSIVASPKARLDAPVELSTYQELMDEVQEDKSVTSSEVKLSQEEIDKIFQEDQD